MAESKRKSSAGAASRRSRVQSGPLKQQRAGGAPTTTRAASSDKKAEQQEAEGRGPAPKLVYSEVKGDLFSCPATSSLGHCVSEDMAMAKGVATLFKEKFGGVAELKAQGAKTGGLAVLKREQRFVYYLVTKARFFHKPTYRTLQSSLDAMREHCRENRISELALPTIGCGLDRLAWDRVSKMIRATFRDEEMAITIYYL